VSDVRSQFSYDANFGPAQTQIRSLVKDITVLNAAFKSLDNEANKVRNARAGSFMSSLGNIGGFNAQIVDLTSDVERFGKALQKNQLTLRQYYKEAAQAYKKNSMARRLAEDEVRRAQSQLVGMGQNQKGRQQGMLITPLTIDTSDINTKMAISQKQFSIFNKLVNDGATQLINWGKNTQWAGRQLTVGLTVPLTIFGAAVSKTFREVDKELTRFAKVYGSDLVGANQQATNTMRSQVEQLSKDFAGKYGIAAKETAGLAADLAATGLEGQKLLDSVAQTTRLAVLGEVDRQEAMKATLALQGAFNMSTTELAESINFLNAVENQTSASLQDLTEAIPRVGPVINSLGGDVKDLAVLLVAMKEGGVNAAEGANAIKSGLASLINPTRQASETAKQYGIDLDGIVKANKGKLMPTIMAFQEALSGLDQFAKAQIIEQLFGKYQFARISALFDNLNASGSQTVEVLKLMGASSQDLAKIANGEIRTLTESSSMRFQRSMEAIKASLIPVGQVLTDAVIPFLEKTANLIQMLVEYASNLPGPVKSFLKVATGFTLVAGPLIMLAGVFGNFLGYITKSAMSITKLGAALAGLRTEKFEMLDDTQLAASKASDILTSGYNNQRASLDKLNIAMEAYLANLREEVTLSSQVFVPGTKTSGRGPKGGKKAKLAEGGQPYVPGSGDGDKVPALLEPGEFVVNKKAAAKYGPLLEDINFNRSPRFQKGGHSGPGSNLTDFIRLQEGGDTQKLANKTILRIRKKSASDQKAQALESFVLRGMDKYKDSPSEFKKFIASLTAELEALDKQGKKYNSKAVLGEPAKPWVLESGVSRSASRSETVRGGSPSEIRRIKRDQAASLNPMEDAIVKRLREAKFTESDIKKFAGVEAAHLSKDRKTIDGVEYKIWRPSNLSWIPRAENKAMEYLTRKGPTQGVFESALKQAGATPNQIKSILAGNHPVSGSSSRDSLLKAFSILEERGMLPAGSRAESWVRATNALNGKSPIYSPTAGILDPTDERYNEEYKSAQLGKGKPKPVDAKTGRPATKRSVGRHQRGGRSVVIDSTETVADRKFVELAENGIDDGTDIKAQRKAVRGQKAGAIGGLAMTAAFTLPAITGTNEALNGLTNNLLIASSAISAFATIAQVRGIGGGGMGMGAKARNLKNASMAYRGVAPQRIPAGMEGAGRSLSREAGIAQAKQQVGAGRVMGAVATKAGGTGRGAGLARGALSTVGLLGGPVGVALVAAIALGTVAFVAYQKAINNARKEGASLFAEQTKAAEYYGIELKTINSAMMENAKIAKEMGFAGAGAVASTVDPELKKAILEQEENKKLVEQLKESSDPASIFLGQYGKMLQQGFNPEQAKEVLSVLAQASGQMGGLTRVSSQINGITTPGQATAAIGESFTKNVGSMFGSNSLVLNTELANAEGRFGELIKAGLTSSDLSEGFKIVEDGIAAAYKEGASKGLSTLTVEETLNKSFKSQLEGLGFKEGDEVYDTVNAIKDSKLQLALVQGAAAGLDMSNFIEDLDVSTAKAKELYLTLASTDALAATNTQAISQAQRVIDEIDKEIQVRTAYFDQLAVNNENAQASEEERTKNFQKNIEKRNKAIQKEIKGIQKAADEQIKTKEKEIDAIEESSDKYLKALQSQKDESSFLASQQQTALGGLGALASGDVIGFLQARDEMASAAQSNAQEEEIKKIEDLTDARITDIEKTIDAIKEKADAEVGTLQDQLEKNQELMDKEGERHENRMAALQKEAIQIQTNKSAEIKAFDDSKAALQEFINTPVGDKLGKDLTKYAEAISNVAANMPAHSKNIMNDLATSFGNNFQSVFDAEVQKSAEEFGVDPTDLKTLVQKSLPKNGGSGAKASDRFAKGGYVSGPGTGTSDSISAQLSNGEYVVKADAVKRIGKDTLDRINSGTGGMVTRTNTVEGYRVGGGEAITAAAAFAGGVKTAVSAITSANALVQAAASVMNEEPENSDGGGTGKTTSVPEQLGKVARILRGNYRVSARGTYPSGNPHSARYGTAIDYATPTGTDVYAMAGGTASNLNRGNSSFGKYVTIRHADGTESLYAHLDSHGQGGTVNAGDFIGETGNTGNSTGPHLHFEWSALKNGFNPPGMRIGGETMSDGLANLHKGELVLTKPLTQQLKDGIAELKFGMPSMSGVSPIDSGTMVSSSNTYNISVDASGPSMDPNKIAQKIVTAISREEDRRSFGRTS